MTSEAYGSLAELFELLFGDDEVTSNEIECLRSFLETNSVVLRETYEGLTLLHYAIIGGENREGVDREFQGCINKCKVLIDHNADLLKTRDVDGNLPIHLACIYDLESEFIELLIDRYPESVNIPDGSFNYYPLHNYVRCFGRQRQRLKTIQLLLRHDKGAVSTPDMYGDFPMHIAAKRCALDIVQGLFNAYPQAIYNENEYGKTPLDEARGHRNRTIAIFLEDQLRLADQARRMTNQDENGQLPIHHVLISRFASLGTIKLMAAANPTSISVADNEGRIPLHFAIQIGDISTVKFLVETSEASLNVYDSNGNYALHHACLGGNCDTVSYILKQSTQGASLHNTDGMLPIELLLYGTSCDFYDEEHDQWHRDTQAYTEAVFQLFCAYPDALKGLVLG